MIPETRAELERLGYKFTKIGACPCQDVLEFWQTPNGSKIGLNLVFSSPPEDRTGSVDRFEEHHRRCPIQLELAKVKQRLSEKTSKQRMLL